MIKLNFSNASNKQIGSSYKPIPENTLSFGVLTVREIKKSANNNDYLDCMVRLSGRYDNRVVFHNIMLTAKNGTAPDIYGSASIRDIIIGTGKDLDADPAAFEFESFDDVAQALDGARVAVRIGISSDNAQKNIVRAFLNDDARSGTAYDYRKLVEQSEDKSEEVPVVQQTVVQQTVVEHPKVPLKKIAVPKVFQKKVIEDTEIPF